MGGGGLFGGGGGGGSSGPGKGVARSLREQRDKVYEYLNAYNTKASPFFNMEANRGAFGESMFPLLQQRITDPTLSPSFKLYGDEGVKLLRSNFATTGSPSSGPAQIAAGRYLAGLGAHQLDKADNMLLAAANFRGILPQTQEPQYLSIASSLAQANAQARAANNAAASGGGDMFSGILGGAASGASIGTQFMPGWGTAIGGLIGAGLGAAGSS